MTQSLGPGARRFVMRVVRVLLKLIAGVVSVLFLVIGLLWWYSIPPSDRSLRRQFFSRQHDMNLLLAMMEQDIHMNRIADDFTWTDTSAAWPRPEPEWGISGARWEEYRSLFRSAGIEGGTNRPEHSSDVMLFRWSFGTVVDSDYVSFLHCGQPGHGLGHTEPPCNEKKAVGSGYDGHRHYRYRRLADDWYIYQETW